MNNLEERETTKARATMENNHVIPFVALCFGALPDKNL